MKIASKKFFPAASALLFGAFCSVTAADEITVVNRKSDVSFRNEIEHAIDRGLEWLRANQNSNGWWSTPEQPAVTALALMTFMAEPSGRYRKNPSPAITNGFAFILSSGQKDGSIQRGKLANYNTALSLVALAAARNPDYEPLILRGRAYLIGSQVDLEAPGKLDSPHDGGIGYADRTHRSDMNNTLVALEGLRATEHFVQDKGMKTRELNWAAAIQFIENCQNLPTVNTQAWVSTNPKDRGGFIYEPGESKAGGETNAAGRVALRSYGSISYAGLLSYIHADLRPEDPRVRAVMDWLRANYTLEENPGMGQQGFYYYLHLMTKGLNAAGVESLQLADGRRVDWRREVAMRLINLQQRDGSWANENNRWWEKDPCLVTAYCLLALEILWGKT